MPVEDLNLEKELPGNELHLAIVGTEGAGKSRLACTGRKPVLVLDYDRRARSLAGIQGVFAKTITDPAPGFQPDAFSNTLNYVSILENSALLKDLGFVGVDPALEVKTVVIDTVQTFAKCAMNYALYGTKEIRRTIRIPGADLMMPGGWDAWSAEMGMVEQVILRLLGIKGMDVICNFHETAEEAPQSTEKNPVFTGKQVVYPVRYKGLLKYFNDVWRVSRLNGPTPTVTILPSYDFELTKCSLGLDSIPSPDIANAINMAQAKAMYNAQSAKP